ncbi:hypothetical protein NL108_002858 [Boleophthalmus pectinirostris]|uniref:glucose-6-phosphatase a, catalytic subunit, tandem duplicate 1 n=1 Tax=Boleophthalmus pectinirostris TaxID=150288 RepID=UPI000A1C227C|nr:glucose-6-phosphatase a, catalytic subunit, tandem duplicate 1 [Boleophthalmus pectinirostris]KAJ0060061.1 hypothetical protein NL108_002858 [Boleophthalmus pectinirostris]
MDLLHSWGVELAVYLQTNYQSYEGLFNLASSVADLHMTFFLFFPIWFHLRRDIAIRLLWVAVIGDWLNLVLKWVLFGERPYWWVKETRFYGTGPAPPLRQFPITCETGPGSPSGHAMGAAGVWYVMITALLSLATEKQCPPLLYTFLQMGLNAIMGSFLLVVCMSRVYMAAHFPHQVIAGVLTGILVAEVISQFKWIYHASLKKYLFTTLFLALFVVGFYLLLEALGVDLLWTMEKAEKWCVHVEWIHLETSPFATLLRHMGTICGLGLGLHSPLNKDTKKRSYTFRMGCVAASLVLLYVFDGWTFSSDNHMSFYSLSFVKSTLVILIPTTIVPWVLYKIFTAERADKKL